MSHFVSDLNGLINGTITATSGLSAGADKANCVISGTYPTSIYATANSTNSSTQLTFSKSHSVYGSGYTQYIRFRFDTNSALSTPQLANVQIAQGYTSANDYIFNATVANTVNYKPLPYANTTPVTSYNTGMEFIITPRSLVLNSLPLGKTFGFFDLSTNAILDAYPQNSRTAFIQLDSTATYASQALVYSISGPTSANVTNFSGYTVQNNPINSSNTFSQIQQPLRASNANSQPLIVEGPLNLINPQQANSVVFIYGAYRLAPGLLSAGTLYNTNAVSRLVVSNDFSIPTD
jgi:hypothetical protein